MNSIKQDELNKALKALNIEVKAPVVDEAQDSPITNEMAKALNGRLDNLEVAIKGLWDIMDALNPKEVDEVTEKGVNIINDVAAGSPNNGSSNNTESGVKDTSAVAGDGEIKTSATVSPGTTDGPQANAGHGADANGGAVTSATVDTSMAKSTNAETEKLEKALGGISSMMEKISTRLSKLENSPNPGKAVTAANFTEKSFQSGGQETTSLEASPDSVTLNLGNKDHKRFIADKLTEMSGISKGVGEGSVNEVMLKAAADVEAGIPLDSAVLAELKKSGILIAQ